MASSIIFAFIDVYVRKLVQIFDTVYLNFSRFVSNTFLYLLQVRH